MFERIYALTQQINAERSPTLESRTAVDGDDEMDTNPRLALSWKRASMKE